MQSSVIAVLAVLGLTGWQWADGTEAHRPVRSAYEDAIQRYQGGETVRDAVGPQRTKPLADAGDAAGVDNARMADGANASGVDVTYRTADGANASGVEVTYRTADGADATGVDNARIG